MRVLVYTPTREGHLYGRSLQSILQIEWPGQLDFMFSRGGDDGEIEHPEKRGAAYIEVTRKYQEARTRCLEGGYDALLCAESDMIIPPEALRQMAEVKADVVYGLYALRHADYRWNALALVGEHLAVSLSQDEAGRKRLWGQVIVVDGVGLGCTLIHRHVLEALPFRVDEAGFACCDWYLSEDCKARGFSQAMHLGVVCGHMSRVPSPRILWPDPECGVRIEMLNVKFEPLQPGEKHEYMVSQGTVVVPARVIHAKSDSTRAQAVL